MKRTILAALALVALAGAVVIGGNGCASTEQRLNEMTETQYQTWVQVTTLASKVTARRLVEEEVIDADDLDLLAGVAEAAATGNFTEPASDLLGPLLEEQGIYQEEIQLVLLLVQQAIQDRGGFDFVTNEDGTYSVGPRTAGLLNAAAAGLRAVSDEYVWLDPVDDGGPWYVDGTEDGGNTSAAHTDDG